MQLTELFNNAFNYELERKDSGSWKAIFFTTNNSRVLVSFDESSTEVKAFDVDFRRGAPGATTYEITGEGDAIRIFSTVIEIIRDFVKRENPNIVTFNAKEPSRKKLYARLATKICPLIGFKNMTDELADMPEVGKVAKFSTLDKINYFAKRLESNTLEGYTNTILVKRAYAVE